MQLRPEIRDRLRRSRDWTTAIDELESELETIEDTAQRSELLFELAQLSEEVFPERDRALAIYQRAWKLHPENLKALRRAREVYFELGRLEMVAKVGQLELKSSADGVAELATMVGEALIDTGQSDKALPVLQTALEQEPDSVRIRDAIAAAEYDQEIWTDIVDKLSAEADKADSSTAARMLLRAARMLLREGGDDGKLEALVRRSLEFDPQSASANFLLESLMVRQERLDELAEHHEKRAYAVADDDERAELYRRFALEWVQRFKDRERAAAFFAKAMQSAGQNGVQSSLVGHVAGFSLLREVFGGRADWDSVLQTLDGVIEKLDDERRLYLAVQGGAIAWRDLDNVDRARRYFDMVRSIDPDAPELGEFDAAVGVTPEPAEEPAEVEIEADEPEIESVEAAAPEPEAAEAAEPEAAEPEAEPEAEAASEPDAAPEPEAEPEAVAAAEPEPEPEPEAPIVEEPPRPSAIVPEVDVDEELSDAARDAIAAAREVEASDAAVDKKIDAWKKAVAADPSLRTARRELARVLTDAERWNALVDSLKEEEAKACHTPESKLAVLSQMVEVYRQQLKLDVMVTKTLDQMLKLAPGNVEIVDQLAGQYESMKRWPDLVSTLNTKAELLEEPGEKIALYLQVANLYIEKFSNQAEAIKAFEKVLELEPDNEEAIGHLKAVYEKRRDWEKLIGLRERELDRLDSDDERAEKVLEIAQLAAQRLKKPAVCIKWWEKVRDYDPQNGDALAELKKFYERDKNWEKLAEICEARAEVEVDTKAKTDALQTLGLLYQDKIDDKEKAIDAWKRLLDVDPVHRRAQDALKKLYVADKAWDDLEAFYRDADKLDEFVRVLEREVDKAEQEDAIVLGLRIARTYRDEIGKNDRAVRAYEKVLTFDDNNLEAAEALIPLYEGGRDPRKIVPVLEIQLEHTEDPATRIERIKRLAEHSEEKLRDPGAAYGWWLKAVSEAPEEAWIREQVERLAATTDGWLNIVEAYEAAYRNFSDKHEALPLMSVVARVLEQELSEHERALATNKQILELDESNEAALEALQRLFVGSGQFEDLLDVYRKKLDITVDGEVRTEIQYKIGQLYEDEVKDDDRAIEAYREILDANGDELGALGALERIYSRNEKWEDLADVLGRQLILVGPDQLERHVELKYNLGQLREKQLDDAFGAIECYREILDLERNDARAREALERWLDDGEQSQMAAGILEPIYEQLEDWTNLIRVHEIQLGDESDSLGRTNLLMRVGELHSKKLGDAEQAFHAYARAFSEDPSHQGARAELEELCNLLDEGWPKLVGLYEKALDKDLDGELVHEYALKVAAAYDERLDDSGKAVDYYRRVLQVEPEDTAALDALERIFAREEKYPELLEVYRKKVDLTSDPEVRVDVLFRIASIHEEMLQNTEEAIRAYNEVLGQDGDNLRALRALDRLYQQSEQWHELADNLSRQLSLAESDHDRVELLVRLASLRENQLEELASAVETYRQVLELSGDNADAIRALERLIGQEDHELSIAQILEPIYKAAAASEKLIGVYEIMAKHAYDPERKIELLHGIAELHELGMDDSNQAFQTYARALREEPSHAMTQQQLDRLARMLTSWEPLIELYDGVAEDVSDEELKVSLLTKLARIYELELENDALAVGTYNRILEAVPGQIDAASAIQAIHERNADYPALVESLKKKSDVIVDLPERKSLLYKAAQIQEEVLEDAEAAIATYQQVLDLDDIDSVALNALERMYIRLERWEPLKDIYHKKADLAEAPDDKKQMLYVLGQVYDRELGDVAKAIETYQAILDIDPDELAAIQALDRLFAQAERPYDLLQNLERQVELAELTGEQVGLKFRIGLLWQEQLNDLARAIEAYKEALDLDPAHAETLTAVDALMRSDEGEPVMAARVLEPIYEAQAEYARLVDVLEVMIKHAEDPITKVELLHRLAALHEQRLENYDAAYDAFARALVEENSNEDTLAHIERLADATRRFADLASLYGAEAEKSLDVPRQVDLLSRLARVCEEELGQVDEAIAAYKKILDVEYDNRDAVFALDRLYSATENWAELTDVLRKEVQLAETDEEIVGLQFRLGQVLEQNLRDLPAAIEVYRDILTSDPNHSATIGALEMMFLEGHHEVEIAGVLEPLYQTAQEWEKLHKIYEVQLSKLDEASERSGMYQRLAELSEQQLYDLPRAFSWWGQSLVEDPASELAVEEAERLARETAGWADLVHVYMRVLEQHHESDVQRHTLLRLGRVYEEEISEPTSAVETFLRALEIDPKDNDALAALDRLYTASGFYDELVDILRRRIEGTLDGDEIVALQFRRGQVYADALNDLDASLACYKEVLEQDPRNRTALEAEEEIYFRREAWTELYAVYEKLLDVAEGEDEIAEVYMRMARLASDALEDEEGASDLWSRVLDIRGEDWQALSALSEIHARREEWHDLVEVLDRAVRVMEDPAAQINTYKRLGRVWEHRLGRERNALDAWLKAYELDNSDLETLRVLAHLYRETQSWEELSGTLRRILELAAISDGVSEDEVIELYAQLGELEGDILGRVNDAVEAWHRVLALNPMDFRALSALEQLFTREARWEECINVLEKRAAVLDDPQERIDTLLQAGAIWQEKVGNNDQAAEVYERVRGADPSNAIASAQLEEVYRAHYNWEKLIEVLLERAEYAEDTNDRIAIFQAVAKIYEGELGDQESAFVVLQAGFREDYAHEEIAAELERLATAAGKWEELLADYTHMVAELEGQNPDSAADLWVKIGRWYGDHLSHVDYAIHSVQQALRINPDHLSALSALADFQRKRGSWGELVEILNRHAAIESNDDKKVELYLNLADLLEGQIQDAVQAMSAYQQALEVDPTCTDALSALERLYRRHEMWEPLIDVLGRRADLVEDEAERIAIRLEIGRLWDEMLVDSGQAINAFQQVVDIDPSNAPALRSLERLYEKTGQSEKYLDVLEAQLDASPDESEQVALYERMASAWEERFGKLDRAAECLEKIVALDDSNQQGYRELARLYRQEGKWDSLVDTYRRHIMSLADPVARIDLYCAMGEVYEIELQDFDRAIESYTDVLTFDPQEPRALDALGRLYERIEEWDRAIDAMQQLVQITAEPPKQVDLYHRIGRITYSYLNEPEQAEQMFLQAQAIDPTHVGTMTDLVELYKHRGDWLKAAQMMVRAEQVTANVLEKVRLLQEAATIYLEKLDAREESKQYFQAVLALDPEHVEASEPLAELLFADQEWAPLEPVLDVLVRKADQMGKTGAELNELYYRTARTADELGNFEKALNYYKAAYDIDSTYLPTLLGRGDLLYKMQDWDGAGKIYQTILVQHRDSQNEDQVVDIYNRLGNVRLNLGERKKALNMFEKALEIDPHHTATLQSVIDIQGAQGDYEAVIQAKRAMLKNADDDQRIVLLDEIGGIYSDQLQNEQKAIGAYLEALEYRADDHSILQKVLDLYTRTKQWKKAVEVIERFAELESEPLRKGKYYQAAGTICRDELKALDQAIDFYNTALDHFFAEGTNIPKSMLPGCLKAFMDIDKILTSKRDWKAQERAYRMMIKRLSPGDTILVDLWHSLGEIYRSRLKHFQSAIQAYEVAQQLQPENVHRNEILAELYIVAGPDYADKAVEQHLQMLRREPYKYDSYKALRRIYMDTHQYDKTWCVCSTLAFLNKADDDEIQFYEQYKPRGFVKARQRMTEDLWRRTYHPDEDLYIGAIFGAVSQAAALLRAVTPKQLGIRRKDRRQVESDQLQFSKIFHYCSQVLGVQMPEVYLQPEQQGEILLANMVDKSQLIPAFVVRAGLLQGRAEREIAFQCARRLSYMRPEHYLKMALPSNTELKTALLAAIVLVQPKFPVPADSKDLVQQYLRPLTDKIQRLPNVMEQLAAVVNRFLQHAGTIDLAKWGNAVDLTTHRMGFIIGGDLSVAAKMVSMEQQVVGGMSVKDKIKELVLYSVSEDYFAVRHHLGTTIG